MAWLQVAAALRLRLRRASASAPLDRKVQSCVARWDAVEVLVCPFRWPCQAPPPGPGAALECRVLPAGHVGPAAPWVPATVPWPRLPRQAEMPAACMRHSVQWQTFGIMT